MQKLKFAFKIIYIVLIVLVSGSANSFFRSYLAIFIVLGISLLISIFDNINLPKAYISFLFVWSLYFLLNYLIVGKFNYLNYFRFIIFAYIGVVFINLFQLNRLLYFYEIIIYYLSIISLIFFSTEVLFGNAFISLLDKFNLRGDLFIDQPHLKYINIIIYTVLRYYDGSIRNCGFAFEPGPFSIFVAFALFFYYLRSNFSSFFNKRSLIFILTILSTLSTTGYILLFIIVFLYIRNDKSIKNYRFMFTLSIFAVFVFLFFYIDILYDKIILLYNSGLEIEDNMNRFAQLNKSFSAGRFGGLYIAYNDFLKFPFGGLGGSRELSYGTFGTNIAALISGFATILSNYGLFGVFALFYLLSASSHKVKYYYPHKLSNIFIILIYFVSIFSFNIHLNYFFFSILFMGLFYYKFNNRLNNRRFADEYMA
jgi:hypothetical protein